MLLNKEDTMRNDFESNYLMHHGILGMKWGIRRYQNKDGSLTEEGKKRYGQTVFVSGSSKTQDKSSDYYRKNLPRPIRKELKKEMKRGNKIIVGDAPGIDRQTQDYLNKKKYENVEVYGPGKKVRYSANSKWKTNPIDAPEFEEGSSEWLAKKDIAMTKAATKAIAVILDEGAKATRNNIKRLEKQKKKVKVYELSKRGWNYDNWYKPGQTFINNTFQQHQDIINRENQRIFQENTQRAIETHQDFVNRQMMYNHMMTMHMF